MPALRRADPPGRRLGSLDLLLPELPAAAAAATEEDATVSEPAGPPPGFRIGHWTDAGAETGCTVILAPPGSRGGVDIRGGGPGTRETDAVSPLANSTVVTAVVFAGGSAYGLAAADGVARWCEGHGLGYETPAGLVPIVPTAVIYDLATGDPSVRPGAEQGSAACEAAKEGVPERGRVGAGAGAAVAKLAGRPSAHPAGVGFSAVRLGDGRHVAALVVANAVGDVIGPDGEALAQPVGSDLRSAEAIAALEGPPEWVPAPRESTTLACVMTDVGLSKAECTMVARMASAGIARAVDPVFTPFDGDACFVVSSGEGAAGSFGVMQAGTAAATAVSAAIHDAVTKSASG
jgi:L-aminopeptidase/D-esterase-like protein